MLSLVCTPFLPCLHMCVRRRQWTYASVYTYLSSSNSLWSPQHDTISIRSHHIVRIDSHTETISHLATPSHTANHSPQLHPAETFKLTRRSQIAHVL
jgi:hypothetical protein